MKFPQPLQLALGFRHGQAACGAHGFNRLVQIDAGYLTVARLSREDPSDKVREHAVFSLTQSSEPEAMAAVVRVAKEDKVPHVRGQALFWLAKRASNRRRARLPKRSTKTPISK